jgi:hypothetical protein
MNKINSRMGKILLFMMVLVVLLSGCKFKSSTTNSTTNSTATTTIPTSTTATTLPSVYSQYQLEYRLYSEFPNVFWCDPDFYPVARVGQEQQNAIAQYLTIRSNQSEFSAILQQLNLPDKTDYTDSEKLLIYKEHKKLTYAVQMTAADGMYNYDLRVGEGQGERIQGTIKTSGEIQITSREPSINTCPICLVQGTLIDTPQGQIPVEQLVKGMPVWTQDDSGKRVVMKIAETAVRPVPLDFQAVRIELDDGRAVTASGQHPTAAGRAIADYQTGDMLDGARVINTSYITYTGGKTYDLLPAGTTGLYWANGILLGSTLKSK